MKDSSQSNLETEDKLFPSKITLQSQGKLYLLEEPWVMGILNITPDSFYEKSRVTEKDSVLSNAEKMIDQGANILDVGGYSSRPGAKNISIEEELNRVIPSVQTLKKTFPETLISVDTFRHQVAYAAIQEGADIVNDISGGNLDPKMLKTVGNAKTPYICMHMRGNPETMQAKTEYTNIEKDILSFFNEKLNQCRKAGINDVIIDPGLGFAKTVDQNYRILKNLSFFKTIKTPILVGVSRKSMIYQFLGITAQDALNGTTALNMAALIHGANILRVHDVKEAVETIKLYKQIYR